MDIARDLFKDEIKSLGMDIDEENAVLSHRKYAMKLSVLS